MAQALYTIARRSILMIPTLHLHVKVFVSVLLNSESGILLLENDDSLLSEN